MVELGGWFNEEFWTGAGTDGRINTKLITKQLESYLPADPAGVLLEDGLLRGWNVETRDSLSRIPLLYGENGKPLYGVSPDAIYADDDGDRALLEIEGGGAVQNNRLMKSDETAMPEPYPPPARQPLGMRRRFQELPGTQIIPFCAPQQNTVEDPAPTPNESSRAPWSRGVSPPCGDCAGSR